MLVLVAGERVPPCGQNKAARDPEQDDDADTIDQWALTRPAENYDTRTRIGKPTRRCWTQVRAQTSDGIDVRRIDERLDADDVVHQSFGDRLLHGRHSELALGVLGVKDHRSSADAYNFRGIQSALSAGCPLQAGPLALRQAWAKR